MGGWTGEWTPRSGIRDALGGISTQLVLPSDQVSTLSWEYCLRDPLRLLGLGVTHGPVGETVEEEEALGKKQRIRMTESCLGHSQRELSAFGERSRGEVRWGEARARAGGVENSRLGLRGMGGGMPPWPHGPRCGLVSFIFSQPVTQQEVPLGRWAEARETDG